MGRAKFLGLVFALGFNHGSNRLIFRDQRGGASRKHLVCKSTQDGDKKHCGDE